MISNLSGATMAKGDTVTVRPVGRPRSSQASAAIIKATLDLLAEGTSVEALTIEAVAARAGVGKATIYRRWPDREALVVDALAHLKGPVPRLPGRSVREDLVVLLSRMGCFHDSRESRIVLSVRSELHRSPRLASRFSAMVEQRRDVLREVLRRGAANGELAADLDVELAVAMLASPMLTQTESRTYPKVDKKQLAERIVDMALAGIGGRGHAGAPGA
ncbi:MAG: TetR/AcrR family transcriptional regulator [Micromonosporaceae bacterium]